MIVTVDAAITIANEAIVLIRRQKPPFTDKLALPGGHVETTDASLKEACAREIREEIALTINPDDLDYVTVLSKPHRDPRYAASLSAVYQFNYYCRQLMTGLMAGDDAAEVFIAQINDLKPEQMAFDHWEVIARLRKT